MSTVHNMNMGNVGTPYLDVYCVNPVMTVLRVTRIILTFCGPKAASLVKSTILC